MACDMNTVNKLLDAARKVCDRDSDRAVAQRMKVSANSVFVWRKGGKITDAHLMALIDLAQADPALAVKVREEEAGSVVERKAWGALWDRLSPVTTVIGAMVLAIGMMPATGRTKTIEINSLHVPNAHSLYIMSRRLRRWLSSFAAALTARRRRWPATWRLADA